MKITTAIFDLDGTLLNTLGDLTDSVNCAIVRRGFAAVTEEETRVRVGNGVRKLIERCIPENKRTEAMIDTCLDEFRTAYNQRMMNRTQPYDGILPLLRQLKKTNPNIEKSMFRAIHGVQLDTFPGFKFRGRAFSFEEAYDLPGFPAGAQAPAADTEEA